MIVKMIGVINSSIRFKDSIRKRIGRPIRFEIRFERKKTIRRSLQNCSNLTCLQRCRWQYWPIFMRLTALASEIREIPRNSLKIQTHGVQGHPRSSILVPIESP